MKACVLIPTFNEAGAIGGLIEKIRQHDLSVIVVDDGSRDNTSVIAREKGAVVLRNPANEGKGASLKKGFGFALEQNYDAVITMDGDGQHRPDDIPYFMRLAQYSQSGIFIGNRMSRAANMPLLRLLTNKFMSWLISAIAKQKIPDTQCGFRLIKKEVLERLKLRTSKYETESEILIKAARAGFKIESVPIKSVYSGEKSKIHPFVDTLRFFRFIIKEL
ncbi:MAG: glycosyltransferase family 2 protein [Candidatus Omnitrophota bacterium]